MSFAQRPWPEVLRVVLIAIGGGLGSVLRYAVQGWVQRRIIAGGSFPLGTMLVNLSGCLVIGLLAGLLMPPRAIPFREEYRSALIIGVLGGYTTFSSFAWETIALADDREFLYASLNVLISVAAGLAAAWIGKHAIQAVYGA